MLFAYMFPVFKLLPSVTLPIYSGLTLREPNIEPDPLPPIIILPVLAPPINTLPVLAPPINTFPELIPPIVTLAPPIVRLVVLSPPIVILFVFNPPTFIVWLFVPPRFNTVVPVPTFNVVTLVVSRLNVGLFDIRFPPSFIYISPDILTHPLISNKKFRLLLKILGIFR